MSASSEVCVEGGVRRSDESNGDEMEKNEERKERKKGKKKKQKKQKNNFSTTAA